MAVVHLLQVAQRQNILTLPVPLLYALHADRGVAPQIDYSIQRTVHHQRFTEFVINAGLGSIHVALVLHYFPKDESIGHRGTF